MRFKIFKCDDASSSYSYDYLQSDIDEFSVYKNYIDIWKGVYK